MIADLNDSSTLHPSCVVHPSPGPIVYYLRNLLVPAGSPVKIGTTGNLPQRIRQMERTDGLAVQVLGWEPGSFHLERQRHAQFARERIGGSEWFWQSFALLDHLEALGCSVPDDLVQVLG